MTKHISRPVFVYSSPVIQWPLSQVFRDWRDLQEIQEYRIQWRLDDSFEKTFHDNMGEQFCQVVYKWVVEKYHDKLQGHGFDGKYTAEGYQQYIWIHVDKALCNEIITTILAALENMYSTEWHKHRVPKLLSTIAIKLSESPVFLAQSISHYQKRNGFSKTQDALHILFHDIMPVRN